MKIIIFFENSLCLCQQNKKTTDPPDSDMTCYMHGNPSYLNAAPSSLQPNYALMWALMLALSWFSRSSAKVCILFLAAKMLLLCGGKEHDQKKNLSDTQINTSRPQNSKSKFLVWGCFLHPRREKGFYQTATQQPRGRRFESMFLKKKNSCNLW